MLVGRVPGWLDEVSGRPLLHNVQGGRQGCSYVYTGRPLLHNVQGGRKGRPYIYTKSNYDYDDGI
jgi:hypothetical protein